MRSADDFLESDGTLLNAISQKVMRLQHINILLQELLPPELREHCQATDLEHGCLTLTATDNSFGMLLRYQTQHILSSLRKNPVFAGLTTINTKIRPIELLPAQIKKEAPKKNLKPISLSEQASDILKECAQNIADKDIRDALEKLAENHRLSKD